MNIQRVVTFDAVLPGVDFVDLPHFYGSGHIRLKPKRREEKCEDK